MRWKAKKVVQALLAWFNYRRTKNPNLPALDRPRSPPAVPCAVPPVRRFSSSSPSHAAPCAAFSPAYPWVLCFRPGAGQRLQPSSHGVRGFRGHKGGGCYRGNESKHWRKPGGGDFWCWWSLLLRRLHQGRRDTEAGKAKTGIIFVQIHYTALGRNTRTLL